MIGFKFSETLLCLSLQLFFSWELKIKCMLHIRAENALFMSAAMLFIGCKIDFEMMKVRIGNHRHEGLLCRTIFMKKKKLLFHEAQHLTLNCVVLLSYTYLIFFLPLQINFFGGECKKSQRCRFLFGFVNYCDLLRMGRWSSRRSMWIYEISISSTEKITLALSFWQSSQILTVNFLFLTNLRFQLHKLPFDIFSIDIFSSYLITLCRLWRIRVPVDATDVVL